MPRKKTISIQPVGFEAPIEIAARELASYLPRLADVSANALPALRASPADPAVDIVLGTSEHLTGLGLRGLPRPHDLDDALAIIPWDGRLYLTGSNPRSVLFAAYRLLEELGIVFVRPGPNGEVLPRRKRLVLPKRPIREQASYRHRGICIEGSPRLEHVLGLLDWMAKKKMNAFQLQFRHSGVFWRRGYHLSPEMDETSRATQLTDEDCYALDDRVIARVKELGMMLHRVGHGWTAFVLGLPGFDWEKSDLRAPREKQSWMADVKGKRDIWSVPINTELCYSNPQAFEALVAEVVTYAARHPEVDILHFWLSDSYNNKCECADCRKKSPTDWYVMLVDAVARRLREERLSTRVLFLAYVDLLWPPDEAQVTTDNVTFMYAPITRCFRHALNDRKCDEAYDRGRPKLNECALPKTNRPQADIARAWKKAKLPDTFLFDYHLMWAGWRDGLGQDIGRVMARDMKDLAALGLNGFMSCQNTRAFYPLPHCPNAMADMLWNEALPEQRHREKIMSAAFGRHARQVEDYFARVNKAFRVGPDYEHKLLDPDSPGALRKLHGLAKLAERAQLRFSGLVKKEKDPVVRESVALIAVHAEHIARIARAYVAALEGDGDRVAAMRAEYEARLPAILREFSPFIDPLVAGPMQQAFDIAEQAAAAPR
ncbi:MAG: DUF4838 domain-containing protein [Armatimonadota bacterium]|nr:MAG: DUF4838 domain-containing protein [Armatimonadota bacterium]